MPGAAAIVMFNSGMSSPIDSAISRVRDARSVDRARAAVDDSYVFRHLGGIGAGDRRLRGALARDSVDDVAETIWRSYWSRRDWRADSLYQRGYECASRRSVI